MNANKMFLSGFNSYKSFSSAAAAVATGLMLVWFYASAQNAEKAAAAAYAKEHRIEVTATRLVAADSHAKVASVGSGTLVR
ncbi:MAG: hypothetical protein JNM76_04240 [Betaproteobacteria bacterium]|nr:hypothetical protein [Betaproteobacteria bacterium]